jgi:hypothetical protein
MLGDGSIGLVNPDTMVYDLVANFFGGPMDNVTPFTAIASQYSKKVMGLYIDNALIYFVFLRGNGSEAMVRKLQSDSLYDSTTSNSNFLLILLDGTILCMETSTDDNIFFAGGSSQFELTKGVAKVFAITFDEDVDYICDIVLPNNIVNTMGVSDINRMKRTDVLIVGTNAAIFVVEWTGSHFVILHQIEEIHSCKNYLGLFFN